MYLADRDALYALMDGVQVLVVDTNVLLYAANQDSEFHAPCRRMLEDLRVEPATVFLTWSICDEFLRVSTHPKVFRSPWTPSA